MFLRTLINIYSIVWLRIQAIKEIVITEDECSSFKKKASLFFHFICQINKSKKGDSYFFCSVKIKITLINGRNNIYFTKYKDTEDEIMHNQR